MTEEELKERVRSWIKPMRLGLPHWIPPSIGGCATADLLRVAGLERVPGALNYWRRKEADDGGGR